MRPSPVGLALVLAAAAALRFWELGHGIPHVIGSEEPLIVNRAFQMMRAGTLNPEFFDHGHLQIYVQLALSVVRFVAGSTSGEWYSLAEASVHPFYVWGRALSAFTGTVTVFVVYSAGLRWGARHALLAAAIMAVVPLHVQYSHLVVPDALLTLLVALTLSLTLAATEKGTWGAFAWAGAAAGLAAASRYHGVLALAMPLAACGASTGLRSSRRAAAGAALVGCVAAFLFAAPYTVLDLPGFLNRFAELSAAARQAPPNATPAALFYVDALRTQFAVPSERGPILVVAWPALVLIAVGLVMAAVRAVRGPGQVRWIVLVSFVVVYGWYMLSRRILDPRHLLPLMPMLCVVAATGVISGVSVLRRYEFSRPVRTALIALLTLAVVAPGAAGAIAYDRNLSRRSTTDLAYDWIRENLPATAVVVVEASALSIPRGVVDGRGIEELRQKTSDEFVADGVEYLIASSDAYGRYLQEPQAYRTEYLAYTRLFSETREVARFAPRRGTPGPELRVLRLVP